MVRFNSALNENSTGNGMEASLKRVSFMLGSSAYLSTSVSIFHFMVLLIGL